VRRLVPFAVALVLGAAAAGLVACGDRSDLIPSDDASRLQDRIAAVRAALDDGDCQRAIAEAGALEAQARLLSDSVDPRLRRRVRSGAKALATEVPEDCVARTETVETTTTETETTEAETVPTTTTPETVPTTTTPETVPTTTQETTPDESGGTPPEGEQ
jgi:hypothetical protein